MDGSERDAAPWRCLFCRMPTAVRLFGVAVCPICRDQLQDFVWVSVVLTLLLPTRFVNGGQYLVEEVLMFGVLVALKHRLPSLFDRFVRHA